MSSARLAPALTAKSNTKPIAYTQWKNKHQKLVNATTLQTSPTVLAFELASFSRAFFFHQGARRKRR